MGEWTTPWNTKVAPGYEMPAYDPSYSKSFSDISDMRAIELKNLINTGKKIVVFYSGGIDSTVTLVALLKNFTTEELKSVSLALNQDSMIENPNFYTKYIQNKFYIIDSQENKYSDLISRGYICVPSDLGDALFGTVLGVKLYSQFNELSNTMSNNTKKLIKNLYYEVASKDVHYSKYKDLIIAYLNSVLAKNKQILQPGDDKFGEIYYNKLVNNINTSTVPIHSLHDFFWWIIFNIKFMHCALRPGILYSGGNNCQDFFENGLFNWFGSTDYQLWSMANNNNGQKINGPIQSSYKFAAKKYIYDFDQNDWYYRYKLKMPSMPTLRLRNYKKNFTDFDSRIGMNSNYDILRFGDPGVDDYIVNRLINFNE
jgi:hypothetical protein